MPLGRALNFFVVVADTRPELFCSAARHDGGRSSSHKPSASAKNPSRPASICFSSLASKTTIESRHGRGTLSVELGKPAPLVCCDRRASRPSGSPSPDPPAGARAPPKSAGRFVGAPCRGKDDLQSPALTGKERLRRRRRRGRSTRGLSVPRRNGQSGAPRGRRETPTAERSISMGIRQIALEASSRVVVVPP